MLSEERHEETTFSFSEKPPQPPERRRESRHLTILRVGALVGPQGRELCLVRNISAGGLMAHVYSRHEMGERVSVELKTTQEIEGFVIWISDSNIGIQFDHPIDVAELLATHVTPDGWRPRTPRVEVDRLATLRCGARLYAANTRDISQGGVKLEVDEALEVGREIVLTMERFRPLQAVVRWCQDGFAGIEFREFLPFNELIGWLRAERDRSH
ncbi:MAG: PilZ protein [Alphaproteobacteria bacterium]|nr:PilZ protein [Alphaproteobacteria bacterium]